MIDNHLHSMYSFILCFLMSIMLIISGILFFEYRFFCTQAQELLVLKQKYYGYIDEIQQRLPSATRSTESLESMQAEDAVMTEEEMLLAQANDDPDDDDDYADESFITINRQADYLKESTIHYLQTQDLDELMTKIDMSQWSSYAAENHTPPSNTAIKLPSTGAQQKIISSAKKPMNDYGFIWPIDKDKFWLSSLYGPRKRMNGTWGFHHGIDMAAVKGTFVKAAKAGKIVEANFQQGYGNTVVIQHTPQLKTRYAHLHTIRVHTGQMVQSGMIVGTVGETGFIRKKGKDGSHLHFEVYENGKRVNPLQCLPRAC